MERAQPRRRLGPTEHQIQSAFVEWVLRVENLPQYRPLRLSFAVPNGARVGVGQAKKLKAEGLRAGVPDWWLPYYRAVPDPRRSVTLGLAIEFKTKRGVVSKDQSRYMEMLRHAGWAVVVARSVEQAKDAVDTYLGISVMSIVA